MAYKHYAADLLIKHGLKADGSGMPSFLGEAGTKDSKIVDIGRLDGPAKHTVNADGRAVAPGFIDNHAHYDGQVARDSHGTFSPQHGSTTVIFGNCSLALAPVRQVGKHCTADFLSYVEAGIDQTVTTMDGSENPSRP